ncbi:MAG: hypothetical protein NT039_00440 [Candidatus Berkelbacteria bacterium]|nr:hypothetical protein [Candidatus Berkelbacteria bacterium]
MDLESRIKILEDKVSLLEKKAEIIVSQESNEKNKEMSPREFLNSYQPSNDVDRVILFGYYLENYQNEDCFNIDDLKKTFYLSKVKLPLNVNDKINLAIKRGHAMEASEKKNDKKAWILTGNGETYISSLKKEKNNTPSVLDMK